MYMIQTPERYGSRSVPTAHEDFGLSPGWEGALERSTLEGILAILMGYRTRKFAWTVRFDHEPLASGLISFGLKFEPYPTRVLRLDGDHERIFAGYSATARNHVRKARRRGVAVRTTTDPEDIQRYYQIYRQLAERKGWRLPLPLELSLELMKLPMESRFLVAEYEHQIIAGGYFLRDGCSVYYLHAANDSAHANLFPSAPVFDEAIRWGCETGARFFNFGGSGQRDSLENFKASWGAGREFNWCFAWTNPLWARLGHLHDTVRRVLHVS
jgi:hypothetical protein